MNTWLLAMQDANTPVCEKMIYFHDFIMVILFFITFLIFLIMVCLFYNKLNNRYLLNNHPIELIWTIVPMLILIFIALPSLKLLYFTEDFHSTTKVTMKSIGRQWYWSYEYSDFRKIQFDSFMIPTDQLKKSEFRLLDVDNRCVLPYNIPIRVLTTSMDVIHAWTVPALGIKMDATPGRLNQTTLFMNRPGLFFGQCSEICGINHSFMPIVIESTNFNHFKNWIMYMANNN